MGWFELDESRRPLVIIRLQTPSPVEHEIGLLTAKLDGILDAGENYALIVETTKNQELTASQRRQLGRWVRDRQAPVARLCVGQAFAIPAMVTRLVLRSIFMIASPPVPYVVVSTPTEAERFCAEKLAERGLRIPLPDLGRESG